MRRIYLAITTMAACFTVFARQPPPQVPPSPISRQLQVEVVRGPERLEMVVPNTASAIGMQLGLVGGLIGAAVQDQQQRTAEANIAPLRDMLDGYSFYDRFEQTLHARLASEGISPDPQFDVNSASWQSGGAEEPEALILIPRFAMDYDFRRFNVTMVAQWVKRTTNTKGKTELKALLVRRYAYTFPIWMGMPAERFAKWAGLGRERMREMMDEAADQLVDMLVYDFSSEGRATWQAKIGKKEFAHISVFGFPGRTIRQKPDWVWVQDQVGKEWPMLHGYHPIIESTEVSIPAVDGVPPQQLNQ